MSFQDLSPLKWSKHSLQWHPDGAALGNAHSFVPRGGGKKALPLPQRCTLPAHEEATLPCVSCCDGHCRCCHSNCNCPCCHCCHCNRRCRHCCHWPSPLPLPASVAVAVGHRHCCFCCRCCRCCHCDCRQPLPLPLPLAIAVAVAVDHHHCYCRHHWPLPLLLPSLSPLPWFKQFKQIMLPLFYLVWALSGALIAVDDWLILLFMGFNHVPVI